MINLVTGIPGSGKTLWTLKTVVDYVKKENAALAAQGKPPRQVYYHGIPELILEGWTLMDSPEDWINLPSHSIIVIDECQSTFRPRAASVKPPPYIAEFETHRHKGLDFFLLTQHPMLIDGNIRRLAGKHYHVVRFYGFQKSTIHEFQQCRDNVDKNLKNSIQTHFVYPKEVFNWYKSADAHTMKKRVPLRLILVIVLPILCIVAAYYGINAIGNINNMEVTKDKMDQNATQTTTDNPSHNNPTNHKNDAEPYSYIKSHTPEIPSLPYTAPIYEEIVKPVTAPFPAACVYSAKKGCRCYTQQGTTMAVDFPVCINIVENGVFMDWETNPKKDNYQLDNVKAQNSPIQNVTLGNTPVIWNQDYPASPNKG